MPPPQLLIVDDDPELRRFLAGELKADGYGVEVSGQPTLIQTVRGVGFMLKEGAVKT